MKTYTYVVLSYVHDTSVGESLNIGVMLTASDETFTACKLDMSATRFQAAFRNFNLQRHLVVARELDAVIKDIDSGRIAELAGGDAGEQMRRIWPDRGLNYRASDTRAGVTEGDYASEVDILYGHFVASQTPEAALMIKTA